MAQKFKGITPVGSLAYVKYQGQGNLNYNQDGYEYQGSVDLTKDDANALLDIIEDFNESLGARQGTYNPITPKTSETDPTVPEGLYRFTFRTKTTFLEKLPGSTQATERQVYIPLLNAKGVAITKEPRPLIGNGSRGCIYYTLASWQRGSGGRAEYGISMFLNRVQVGSLIPYEEVQAQEIDGDFGNDDFDGLDDDYVPYATPETTPAKPSTPAKAPSTPAKPSLPPRTRTRL